MTIADTCKTVQNFHISKAICLKAATTAKILVVIARQHTDARYWYSNSVCLSVCPSVRPWRSGIRWKRLNLFVIVFTVRYPIILVLSASNIFTKFRRSHPCGGEKCRWGIKNSLFSTNKSLHLADDTRQRHSYYRRRIGNRTQAFEWHQFQWSWVTSKPDFKVTV